MTLVSIGVPVRNGASGIAKALASLSAQTHSNIEILVSDNASIDDTPAIVKRASELDSRIRLVRQTKNIGMFGNFRAVLDAAKGEYFLWAAHDDTRDADYIETLLAGLKETPEAVVAMGKVVTVFQNRTTVIAPNPSTMGMNLSQRMRVTGQRTPPFTLYGLWRTSILRRIPMREAFWSADTPIILAASALGPFLYVPETSFIYHETPKHFFRNPIAALASVPVVMLNSFRASATVAGPVAGMIAAREMFGVLWRQTRTFVAIRLPAIAIRRSGC